jgi:hypothetical protein
MNEDFIPASDEALKHHIKQHAKDCELEDPTGVWLWCSHETFAAVLCLGCFEMVFAASHPNKNHRCEHNEAFFDHLERNLCQET